MAQRILVLLLSFFLTASAVAQSVGTVTRLRGDAQVAAPTAHALAAGAGVSAGEVITTGADARLELTLSDGTLVTLGESAKLTLDEFVYRVDSNTGKAALSMAAGAFRVVTGRIAKQADHPFLVTTQLGTIGIRGTDFFAGPLDAPLAVFLFDGQVSVTTPGGAVILNPGEGTSIAAPGAVPTEPVRWKQPKIDRALAAVGF